MALSRSILHAAGYFHWGACFILTFLDKCLCNSRRYLLGTCLRRTSQKSLDSWMTFPNWLFWDFISHAVSCILVSGVFTVSGILDSFIYHGQRAIKKKMEIGKFSWGKASASAILLQSHRLIFPRNGPSSMGAYWDGMGGQSSIHLQASPSWGHHCSQMTMVELFVGGICFDQMDGSGLMTLLNLNSMVILLSCPVASICCWVVFLRWTNQAFFFNQCWRNQASQKLLDPLDWQSRWSRVHHLTIEFANMHHMIKQVMLISWTNHCILASHNVDLRPSFCWYSSLVWWLIHGRLLLLFFLWIAYRTHQGMGGFTSL